MGKDLNKCEFTGVIVDPVGSKQMGSGDDFAWVKLKVEAGKGFGYHPLKAFGDMATQLSGIRPGQRVRVVCEGRPGSREVEGKRVDSYAFVVQELELQDRDGNTQRQRPRQQEQQRDSRRGPPPTRGGYRDSSPADNDPDANTPF